MTGTLGMCFSFSIAFTKWCANAEAICGFFFITSKMKLCVAQKAFDNNIFCTH